MFEERRWHLSRENDIDFICRWLSIREGNDRAYDDISVNYINCCLAKNHYLEVIGTIEVKNNLCRKLKVFNLTLIIIIFRLMNVSLSSFIEHDTKLFVE